MAANSTSVVFALRAESERLKRDLDKAKSNMSSFKTQTTAISGKIAGALAGAFAIKEIGQFVFAINQAAGEAQGVKAAFDRLKDSKRILEELKAATGGTVDELSLMKRTVQAANFGISLEALPKLLEFATLRAQQTGQSVDYLVDSIITGIGRKSPLILDNLGISAVALKEKLGDVSIAAADVGTVAEAVGAIASDELQNMAGFSENATTKVQRLGASWEDFKGTLGELTLAGNSFYDILNDIVRTAEVGVKKLMGTYGEFKDEAVSAFGDIQEAEEKLLRNLNKKNMALDAQKWVKVYAKDISDALGSLEKKSGETTETLRADFEVLQRNLTKHKEAVRSSTMADDKKLIVLNYLDEAYQRVTKLLERKTKTEIEAAAAAEELNKKTKPIPVTLELLNKKLQELKDARFTALSHQIAGIDRQIKGLQIQIENFGKNTEAPPLVLPVMLTFGDMGSGSFNEMGQQAISGITAQDLIPTGFEAELDAFFKSLVIPDEVLQEQKESFDSAVTQADGFRSQMNWQAEAMNNVLKDTFANMAVALGEALGTGKMEELFANLVGIMAEGIVNMGKLLIQMGMVEVAAFNAPPGAKIAIGIAAVAIGSRLKKAGATLGNNMRRGSGGGYGGGGSFDNGVRGQSQEIHITGMVRGRDIAYSQGQNAQKDLRAKANF